MIFLSASNDSEFILINDAGGLAYGCNQICEFHHERGVVEVALLRWKISFDQQLVRQEEAAMRANTSAPYVIDQNRHATIVELKGQGLSLNAIARKLEWSRSAVQETYSRHPERCGCKKLDAAAMKAAIKAAMGLIQRHQQ